MGTEHLYRRGRLWWAWVYDATTGDRISFSTGCTDKTAARLILAQRERDAADPDTAKKRGATLGDCFDLLLKDRKSLVTAGKRSESTVSFYEDHLRPWCLFAARHARDETDMSEDVLSSDEREELIAYGRKVALIDAADERFTDSFVLYRRANGTSENTIAKDRTTFRAALRLAKRARLWSGDLELLFPRGFDSGYTPNRVFLSREQGFALLRAFDAVPTGRGAWAPAPHRRAYLSFFFATGADLSDVPRARREDIGPTLVRVRGTKNENRDRMVPIVTDWQRELLAYVKEHADGTEGLLFSSWTSIHRSILAACKRARVPRQSPRRLRHTFAHWMKAEGIPNEELFIAMGHANTKMLEGVYGKTEGEELRHAMLGSVAERRAALTVIDGGKATAKTSGKPKKDARLFLRGSTWYAWVYEEGERVQFSTGCTNRAAAVRALAQREKDGLPVKSSAGKTASECSRGVASDPTLSVRGGSHGNPTLQILRENCGPRQT